MKDAFITARAHALTHIVPRLVSVSRSPLFWVCLVLLFGQVDAEARVGGGQSYSGGGSSGGGGFSTGGGGSGGGGGEAEIIWLLLWLCIEYPYIGIPLVLIIGVVFLISSFRSGGAKDSWHSAGTPAWEPQRASTSGSPYSPTQTSAVGRVDAEAIRKFDPNFSLLLLEDFLASLFARAFEARGDGEEALALLAPWLSEEVRDLLTPSPGLGLSDVRGVIVGSQTIKNLSGLSGDTLSLTVEYEANYAEVTTASQGVPITWYTVQRWHLSRKKTAVSRKPDVLLAFNCPNCGAPVEESQDDRCAACDTVFDSGEFDWFVDKITVLRREHRGPQLTGNPPERGTDMSTILAPDLEARFHALKGRDPDFDLGEMKQRARMIFMTVQSAWTELRWEDARPFATDRFHMAQSYWIDAYKDQGMRNVLEEVSLSRMEPVKIATDPFFDAVTYRLWASCRDYTIDIKNGRVVGGNKNRLRRFSEYWTFIRAAGTTGKPRTDKNCPNCGAKLIVNQAGHCEYCAVKIVGGDFDWVLSRIEQDESYRG